MAKKFKILVGGVWKVTKNELEVLSPYDNKVVGLTYQAGQDDIEDAVSAADSVFKELRAMPAYERANIIKKVVEGLDQRSEEVARIITLESGKAIKDARVEVARSINTFTIAMEEAKRQGGEVIPLDTYPGSEKRSGIVRRFPVGPVLGISPFNFPLNLVAHKVAPAMACGCPMILKPSGVTPLTALILGEIISQAGWPAGALSVIPSSGKDIGKLMDDDRIKKLTFTGSPAVGWMLKAKAGSKKVTLELGGNAALIIHKDADIEHAASRCLVGAFSYSGQVCISIQRIYIHADIFEEFKGRFIKKIGSLKLGDPLDDTTDIGPMIDSTSLERTESWVKEAVSLGAEVLAGGKSDGPCFLPTVLTNTVPSMKVCTNEIFAPVVTLEPYESFDKAVEMVNNSLYGLQAGIFTNDINRIFKAYEDLEVGGVIINDIPTYRVDNMPYGGLKMSGFGREGVKYAIEEMTEIKLLALNLK